MRILSVMALLAVLVLRTDAFAEIQTFTATHSYILGEHDSKDDARQRCLLEAKRKVLEQAGVYIESTSEVTDFVLTKDKITSFAAAVMQVKETKEDVSLQQGHMTLTLTLTAQVDLAEVRKQLTARQLNADVRDTVAAQQERLKRLEVQLEAIQQQMQQAPGRTPSPPTSGISTVDVQTLHTQAAQGNVPAQVELGYRYDVGKGVQQDYTTARQWYEKAASHGNVVAQNNLGRLYAMGLGVPQDYAMEREWYEKAAVQGDARAQNKLGDLYYLGLGVPQDYAKAQQWYEKASAQGDATSQYWLGILYFMGQGVPRDYAKARLWWEEASVQSLTKAQVNLGILYEVGRGVQQNYVLSYMWYSLAVIGGSDAQPFLNESLLGRLPKVMTPQQLREAQRLVLDWIPKKQGMP